MTVFSVPKSTPTTVEELVLADCKRLKGCVCQRTTHLRGCATVAQQGFTGWCLKVMERSSGVSED